MLPFWMKRLHQFYARNHERTIEIPKRSPDFSFSKRDFGRSKLLSWNEAKRGLYEQYTKAQTEHNKAVCSLVRITNHFVYTKAQTEYNKALLWSILKTIGGTPPNPK
jgi:hypothetical protein